jgi:hypothetical protein
MFNAATVGHKRVGRNRCPDAPIAVAPVASLRCVIDFVGISDHDHRNPRQHHRNKQSRRICYIVNK